MATIGQPPVYPCGGGSAGIDTIDALAEALVGSDATAPPAPKRPTPGERRLLYELVDTALKDAAGKPGRQRDDAREWLRDVLAPMSARYCFDHLGVDYDSAIARLEATWRKLK